MKDCSILQEQVNHVGRWCAENQLPINIDKCKVCTFTLKKQPLLFNYTLDDVSLVRCTNIKDLGVIFDTKLSYTDHLNAIVNAANKTLGFIVRNSTSFNNVTALKCIYFSLVRSKLEYCSLIWYPHSQIHINSLERIQRRFLKFLTFRVDNYYPNRGYDHKLLLERFKIQPLHTRRILHSLSFLFKLFHANVDSPSLLGSFNIRVPRFGSRDDCMFYCQNARTNVLVKSPIYVMANNYNHISRHCDINACNLNNLLAAATNFFDNM